MHSVTLPLIAGTEELRIDPHFFGLRSFVDALSNGISEGHPIAEPFFTKIRNGENLAASLYIRDEQPTSTFFNRLGQGDVRESEHRYPVGHRSAHVLKAVEYQLSRLRCSGAYPPRSEVARWKI